MEKSERYERGLKKFEDVIGYPAPEKGPAFLRLTLENLFADVWCREGMSTRDRRLITLTVLVLQNRRESLLGHLRQALRSGDLSKREVSELMIHLAHYAGWPTGQFGFEAAMEVMFEGQDAAGEGAADGS